MTDDSKRRCSWAGEDELMLGYHDEEWGVPAKDDLIWYEFVVHCFRYKELFGRT